VTPPTAPARRSFVVPRRALLRLGAYLLVCWTVVWVLARGTAAYAGTGVVVVALYSSLPLLAFLVWGGWPFYPGAAFRVLVVRAVLYVQLLLPIVVLAAFVGVLGGGVTGAPLAGARLVAGGVAAVMLVLLLAGYANSKRLRERRLTLTLPGLPVAFDGMTIAQINDLHVGPQTSRRFLRRVRRAIDRAAPDMVVMPGDLIDDRPEDIHIVSETLGGITAPMGVYISPGNHEIYHGWREMEHGLIASGIGTLLVNDSRLIERAGMELAIVGLGDPAGRMVHVPAVAPDIAKALGGVRVGIPVLALAHNPALWPSLVTRGVALTLSGHTHWGQFAIPQLGWCLATPFIEHAMGHYTDASGAQLYVSPGTGFWGIPFRIGSVAEVTLLTLRSAPGTASA
jgi:predicted MPP superfamily phosphohydrolase